MPKKRSKMSESDYIKHHDEWGMVLVEWANCLCISQPMKCIADLRGGSFLVSILELLTETVMTVEDVLPALYSFLKTKYLNFELPDKQLLGALDNRELTALASLLMHYTCVQDRRESFISPLCSNLSEDVQLNIKAFLENFTAASKQADLKTYISKAIVQNVAPRTGTPRSMYPWQSSGDTPFRGNSPLQDFLRTPSKAGRILEKEREIKKLSQALQMEKFEKDDMLMELEEHKEKIKHLNEQVNNKNLTITKLRSELVALENRTPPHKPHDMKEIERLLRVELLDSKEYIGHLQVEIDELQTGKEAALKKLRKCEEDSCLWQKKALAYESSYEIVTEKYRNQELELSSLRVNCNELSGLLDEMRSSNKRNVSFDFDTSGGNVEHQICCENLGHSVVDVQLREVQRENDELNQSLEEAKQKSVNLEENLFQLKREFSILTNKHQDLMGDTQSMESKILELQKSEETLQQTNQQLTYRVEELSEENTLQHDDMIKLQNSLQETNLILSKREELFFSLQGDLKCLQGNHRDLQDEMTDRNKSYEALQKESMALQDLYEQTLRNYSKKEFETQSLRKLYNELDEKMEQNLKSLEVCLYGTNELCFENKPDAFKILLEKLKAKNKEVEIERCGFSESITAHQLLVVKLEDEISLLKKSNEVSLESIQRITRQLEDGELRSRKLEGEVDLRDKKIEALNETINNLNVTISDLELLKSIIEEKELVINKLNTENCGLREKVKSKKVQIRSKTFDNERMTLLLQELEAAQKGLEIDLDAKSTELEEVKKNTVENEDRLLKEIARKDTEHKAKIEEIQQKYTELNKDTFKKINALNTQIQSYEKHIETLELDIKLAEDDSNIKALQVEDLAKLNVQLESQYEKQMGELEKKINLLELTSENLAGILAKTENEKSSLAAEYEDQVQFCKRLQEEKYQYLDQCEALRKEVVNLKEQITTKEDLCRQKDDVISKSSRELVSLKLLLENKHQEVTSMKEKADLLHCEKEKTKASIEDMKRQNESLEKKLESMTIESDLLNKLKEELLIKYDTLDTNMFNIVNQLGVKRDALTEGIEDLISFRESGQLEIKQLKLSLADANANLETLHEDYLAATTSHEKEIFEASKTIGVLNGELEALKTREIGALQEICILKDELAYNMNKYADAMESQKDLKIENEAQITNLTENIHIMVQKYNNLDSKHSSILEELTESKRVLEEMAVVKQHFEIEIINQKRQYENDFAGAAEQYKAEMEALTSQQTRLEDKIEKTKRKLKEECSSRIRIESELDSTKLELKTVLEERTELLTKIESLINSNRQFSSEYSDLKIQHENYLRESRNTLSKTQLELEGNIEDMMSQQIRFEQQISDLQAEVVELTEIFNKKRKENESDLRNKEANIKDLTEKIARFEGNIHRLETEQFELNEQIVNAKNEYSKLANECKTKNDLIAVMEIKITKLNCAYDILDTGKRKLEETYEESLKCYDLLCNEKHNAELKYAKEIKSLQMKIKNTEKLLEEKVNELKCKSKMIEKTSNEIIVINNILETMKEESLAINNEKYKLEQNKNDLEKQLEMIAEDNDRKIKEQINVFKLLKSRYDQLRGEAKETQANFDDLKQELFYVSQEKKYAEKLIKEKEDTITELQNKNDSLANILLNKDGTITTLQEELEAKLEQMEGVSWEKRCIEVKLLKAQEDLVTATKTHEEATREQAALVKQLETSLTEKHEKAIELNARIISSNMVLADADKAKDQIEQALNDERKSRQFFELQLMEVQNEKFQHQLLLKKLKENIEKLSLLIHGKPVEVSEEIDFEFLNIVVNDTEMRLVEIFARSRELNEVIRTLENDKQETIKKLSELESCNGLLGEEKTRLMEKYDRLHTEKSLLLQEKEKETKYLGNLKTQYELLKQKYDVTVNNDGKENIDLQIKLDELKVKNSKVYENYEKFIAHSKIIKKEIDKMISERNILETLVSTLKVNHVSLQVKSAFVTEDLHRLHHEQKQALEVIVEDIQKQYNRYSKMAYNINLNTYQIFEKTITGILTDKPVNWQSLFKDLNIEEILDKLEDLKDNCTNTIDQLNSFEKSIEVLNLKGEFKHHRVLRENIQQVPTSYKLKEDDWKKKYMNIKQRLTLIENTKNNYEKKIKQLRVENKSLVQNITPVNVTPVNVTPVDVTPVNANEDVHVLQHDQELHKKLIAESESKYNTILKEFEHYKTNEGAAQLEHVKHLTQEVEKVRDAYSSVLTDKSKLELENITLRKVLDERNTQLSGLHSIKEAYEKKFEENNKLMAENDTLKYKRNRDREEYVRLLKKEKEEADVNKRVQEVKAECEIKLEKMKDKLINLYKEEVDKQIEKVVAEKDQNNHLLRTITKLNEKLDDANVKVKELEKSQKQPNMYNQLSGNSLQRPSSRSLRSSTQSLIGPCGETGYVDERRFSTMPRNVTGIAGMGMIEEVQICRRTSFTSTPATANIEMEDEAEMFNNKYLRDLKEGRDLPQPGHESAAGRLSVLAYRNSLCPPHLQSSYPAETQFMNPRKFRDDDLKTGNLDCDDTMSTRLLPIDKQRKKDVGTTTYKRPGPPTPSKNGGRASLQGNEPHPREVLRETNEQKRTTPNRLKALFSRSKDTSENAPGTPKGKRLSIFRR